MAAAMRVGLKYEAVKSAMGMMGIKKKKRAAIFSDVQLMELAALKVWAERGR